MSGIWGKNIKLSIFGESHSNAIGITINGIPAGTSLDFELIEREMERRAPGRNKYATARKEADHFEVLSGYFNGFTTGTPLSILIRNKDQHSKDYSSLAHTMRPGHADYSGNIRYEGFNDYRGGGHFSGRLTAPIVFAGAIAKQLLEKRKVCIGSHIYSIRNVYDTPFDKVALSSTLLESLVEKEFPLLSLEKEEEMKAEIISAKEAHDSVGGIIEGVILSLPAGVGSPFFHSLESTLSQLLFSIPGVKGVEFGDGFYITELKGSEANDAYYVAPSDKTKIKTYTNHNGGVLGGISTGMPIVFRVAFKPTPSIGLAQQTVNLQTNKNTTLCIKGRHDPCIVPRAVPVVEAMAALAILDLWLDNPKQFFETNIEKRDRLE